LAHLEGNLDGLELRPVVLDVAVLDVAVLDLAVLGLAFVMSPVPSP
jgi:hypothetical protein